MGVARWLVIGYNKDMDNVKEVKRARHIQINFRVNAEEKAWLEEMSMKRGIALSQYLRLILLGVKRA